ncbi:hypothetical protein BC628DRAFT_1313796 [Trametes gibbosa]|nr:hypothetical protein BC628DRAFT_1313796 [Trametes gibbosa]
MTETLSPIGDVPNPFARKLARITLTPHTLAFFLLSIIHCIAQGLTAAFLYSEDAGTSAFVNSILHIAEVPRNEVARLFRDGDNLTLKLCTAAPIGDVYKDCTTIWETGMTVNGTGMFVPRTVALEDLVFQAAHTSFVRRAPEGTSLTAIRDPSTGKVSAVEMVYNNGGNSVVLSEQCARMLEYPGRILDNSQREDLALIGSQFWLLGISTFGILWNSIPHIWAVVFARVMQTAWATYTIWRTTDVKLRYYKLIVDGATPCHFDYMPSYFGTRLALQIPELILNVTALLSTSFLAWHIVKGYSSSTIRRVGPPPRVMRLYKANLINIWQFFLIDSMFLQLSLFFTVTAISLWIDQLRNSEISVLAKRSPLYYALFIFTAATIIPWMAMGWFSVRKEMKLLIGAFLFLNVCYIVGWGVMFYAQVYLWTFIEWPFFACTTIVSFIVLIGALVFGIICWTGFGQGLAHYLHVEAVLTDSDFDADVFTNEDTEKGSSTASSPGIRCPSALGDPGMEGIPTIKKDGNWNFADADLDKPRIYMVDFLESKGSTSSQPN